MPRLFALAICLSLLGCSETFTNTGIQDSVDEPSSTSRDNGDTISNTFVASPEQCSQWKESATFVLTKALLASQMLKDDAAYATQLSDDTPDIIKIDPIEMRRHLEVLRTIPDSVSETVWEKPGQVVENFDKALTRLESSLKAQTPFAIDAEATESLRGKFEELYMQGAPSLSEAARACGCIF